MKQIFGILTALITAILIIFMAQMIRDGIYPQPSGLNFDSNNELRAWMETLPDKAFIIIGISHGLASFSAGLISSLTAGFSRMTFGIISVSIIFIPVMIYLFTYHFPVWFVVTDTFITALFGFVGVMIGSARYVN
ncbi:MAG: hypothetical protein H7X99_07410 [Saprospiraceae bacterium]|nr:hypothetical protein [Saprospiraceae bacterium]